MRSRRVRHDWLTHTQDINYNSISLSCCYYPLKIFQISEPKIKDFFQTNANLSGFLILTIVRLYQNHPLIYNVLSLYHVPAPVVFDWTANTSRSEFIYVKLLEKHLTCGQCSVNDKAIIWNTILYSKDKGSFFKVSLLLYK